MVRVKLVVAAAALAFALSAVAAKTKLSHEWKSDLYTGGPFTKILVIGVTESEEHRKAYEDVVARAIGKGETTAIASYTLLPGSGKLEKDDVLEVVEREDFDGVTVTWSFGEVETEGFQNPQLSRHLFGSYYNRAWGYWEPGYQVTTAKTYLSTGLFNVADKKEVWSVYTETPSRGSDKSIINSIAPALARSLRNYDLIR